MARSRDVLHLAWEIQETLQAASAGDYSKRLDVSISETLADNPLMTIVPAINLLLDDLRAKEKKRRRADEALQAAMGDLQAKLEIIEMQRETVLELSTPVLEVWNGVVALPLIGVIDAARSQQAIEGLLRAVSDKHSRVVIIDLTGVPVIDTAVASHLFKAIDAVGLLGAEVIVTGIGRQNALAVSKLGIQTERLRTMGTLKAGLECALKLTAELGDNAS
jgi:rsbT co-antagonist protein RsbR